jgi:Leucine-rich repeat (LRR) protein
MTPLIGINLLDYESQIPDKASLPVQIAMVKLSTPQLLRLNTQRASWRMARIEERGEADTKDELLLEKPAALNTLEVLEFQFCHITSGVVFKKFGKLRRLKISPVLSRETQFLPALSVLTGLKELAIYSITDTSQSFSALEKFQNLESLDLRWIDRFKNHPDELSSIGRLTKLRSLIMQSVDLSVCPDFFQPLSKLESVTMRWNKDKWTDSSSFSLPEGLFQLPELKSLIIWKTISTTPDFKNLKKLQLLDLSYNNLKQVPEGLSELKQLKTLFLAGNQLTDLQALSWGKLTGLENLDLARNTITRFPYGVQHLRQLKYLNLAANKITSIPALDEGDYQMKILALDNNALQQLPANIDHYTNLQLLSASNCSLSTLPDGIGGLRRLKDLNLEGNKLKLLPKGLADNPSLQNINLKNNREMDEQSIHQVVFGHQKKRFLYANLDNTGLSTLPKNAPWRTLKLVLDLSNNQLKTLPIEVTKMKSIYITLKNNPLPVDTGFIERGISNAADAKILLNELGYQTVNVRVSDKDLAASMYKAAGWLSYKNSYKKALKYVESAQALDSSAFNENIDWYAIGMARFKTKDYKKAITDLNTHLQRSIYRT